MRIIIELDEQGRVRTEAGRTAQTTGGDAPMVEARLGESADAGPPVLPMSLDEEIAELASIEANAPGGRSDEDTGGPPDLDGERGETR